MNRTIANYVTMILIIPAILFICIVCSALSYIIFDQKTETLSVSVKNLGEYINSVYTTQLDGMKNTVSLPELSTYLHDPSNPDLYNQARESLFNTFSVNNAASDIALVSSDGTLLITSMSDQEQLEKMDWDLFQAVVTEGTPKTNLVFESDIPSLAMGYPISENNQVLGVYIRVTPLNYISFYAENVNANQEDIFLLTDSTAVAYRTLGEDKKGILEIIKRDSDQYHLIEDLRQNLNPSDSNSIITYDYNGISTVGVYYYLPNLNWYCMIAQPRAYMYYDLNIFQLLMIATALGIILIFSYITVRLLSTIFNPLEENSKTLKKILSGESSIRCKTGDQTIIGEIGDNINQLADENQRLQIYNAELEQEMTDLLTKDKITGLSNNRALYSVIDEFFGKDDNQAIIMFNTGVFDRLYKTYGYSVTNRLLEKITDIVKEFVSPYVYPARLNKDLFCFFISHFDDHLIFEDTTKQLLHRLKLLTHIDDLQIELDPHLAVVFRDPHLLGRSDWLRLAIEQLRKAEKEGKEVIYFDFLSLDDLNQQEPELYENIFLKNNEPIEGFSKSTRYKNSE